MKKITNQTKNNRTAARYLFPLLLLHLFTAGCNSLEYFKFDHTYPQTMSTLKAQTSFAWHEASTELHQIMYISHLFSVENFVSFGSPDNYVKPNAYNLQFQSLIGWAHMPSRQMSVAVGQEDGRDSTRPAELKGWLGRFGHDLDDLDGALQRLRDRLGESWLADMLEKSEATPTTGETT